MSEPLNYYTRPILTEPVLGYPVHTDGDSYVPVAHVFTDAPGGREMVEQLVLRYNAHDALVAALDGCMAHLDIAHDARTTDDDWMHDLYGQVRAALNLARGERE